MIFFTINPKIVYSENLTLNISEKTIVSDFVNNTPITDLWTVKDLVRQSNESNTILGIFGIVAAIGSFLGGWFLSNQNSNKVIRAMVDIANAGYRITKVDSGKVAIRGDGKIGADLVKVIGGKRIVAEKMKTFTADAILKYQEDVENQNKSDTKKDDSEKS